MGIEFEFVHKGKVVDTGVFDHEDDALIACNTVEMNLGLPEWSVGCRVATKIEEEKMKKFEVFKWEKLIRGTNSRGYTYTRAGNKELLATINAVSYREAHFKATKLAKEQGFSVRLLQVKLIKLRRRSDILTTLKCGASSGKELRSYFPHIVPDSQTVAFPKEGLTQSSTGVDSDKPCPICKILCAELRSR